MKTSLRRASLGLATAALLGLGIGACATAPRPRAEPLPTAEGRISDSRPERVAAQRAAAPAGLELQQSDERWGIEAARDRREAAAQNQAKKPATAPAAKSAVVPVPGPVPASSTPAH